MLYPKVFPDYKGNCFSNIPQIILTFFELEKKNNLRFKGIPDSFFEKENLIAFFIDSFGWRFIEKYSEHPFLKKLQKHGKLIKATSQFPSTTAAHVTTANTGLSVGEHGVYEWFYYEPEIDEVIAPLLFSIAGPKENRGNLDKFGVKPEDLFHFETIYQKLKNKGVNSFAFGYKEYTPSAYSETVFKGAKAIIPYSTFPEAITNVFEVLESEKGKKYIYLYFEKIDSMNHTYGPSSSQSEAEIIAFLEVMDKVFWPKFEKVIQNTGFLLFADHGHMEIDPKKTFYLNKELPEIEKYLKINKKGKILAPAGSPRDMFLYVREEYLQEAKELLSEKLPSVAEVFEVKDLIEKGYFGEKISERFLQRVGNLLLLPYPGESVWWYEKDRFEVRYYGHHGGMSKEEMEIGVGVV